MFVFEQSSICLIGPTSSGKTIFLKSLIEYKLFAKSITNVLCCYLVHQEVYEEMSKHVPNFQLHNGLPNKETVDQFLDQSNGHSLIILDDLGHALGSNPDIASYFSVGTHHRNFTLVTVLQQIFFKGKHAKLMQVNCGYICLFHQSRDASQVAILARQLYPTRWRYFVEAYEDATSRKHGYLLIDTRPYVPEDRKLLTNILPGEETTVYVIQKSIRASQPKQN